MKTCCMLIDHAESLVHVLLFIHLDSKLRRGISQVKIPFKGKIKVDWSIKPGDDIGSNIIIHPWREWISSFTHDRNHVTRIYNNITN